MPNSQGSQAAPDPLTPYDICARCHWPRHMHAGQTCFVVHSVHDFVPYGLGVVCVSRSYLNRLFDLDLAVSPHDAAPTLDPEENRQ